MELLMGKCLCLLVCILTASVSSSPTCKRDSRTFLHDLNSQCPLSILWTSSPIQLDGESFESVMSSMQNNEYAAVLFYASWCPFSSIFLSTFSTLSSMYPQIKHIMIEQTSVLPSVFSRYGIHSIPSLLITNQTTTMKYHGEKDLRSLVNFYERTTGMDPVVDMVEDTSCNSESNQKVLQLWNRATLKEIFLSELYLVLSVVFVLSRAFLYFFPEIASHIRVFWVAYIPHLNMEIFGESRQLVSRVLQLVDVKRIWSKMKLCKTRNFQKGARNARVWASSLASFSLGEHRHQEYFLQETCELVVYCLALKLTTATSSSRVERSGRWGYFRPFLCFIRTPPLTRSLVTYVCGH